LWASRFPPHFKKFRTQADHALPQTEVPSCISSLFWSSQVSSQAALYCCVCVASREAEQQSPQRGTQVGGVATAGGGVFYVSYRSALAWHGQQWPGNPSGRWPTRSYRRYSPASPHGRTRHDPNRARRPVPQRHHGEDHDHGNGAGMHSSANPTSRVHQRVDAKRPDGDAQRGRWYCQ